MTHPYPLGRHVNHDPRSLAFPFNAENVTVQSVRWTRKAPVFDQGNLGSCTGNAAVGCIGTEPYVDTLPAIHPLLDEAYAVSVYSAATKIDEFTGEYPPTDTGSNGLSVAKVLKAQNLISGYTHAFDFNSALAALSTGPVIVGTNWYQSMFNPDSSGIISIAGGSQPVGGHEYILDEIDVPRQLVGMQNSWGTGWGKGGRAYMTFATLQRLLSEQGDVTVFVPVTQPAPVPVPPTPQPVPVDPTPTPVDDDLALWQSIRDWACGKRSGPNKRAASLIRAWAKGKGY
jgi:hypothetical protein